jgi:hypothetical protein
MLGIHPPIAIFTKGKPTAAANNSVRKRYVFSAKEAAIIKLPVFEESSALR